MGVVTYYVAMGFERDEAGELVAMDPLDAVILFSAGEVPDDVMMYAGHG